MESQNTQDIYVIGDYNVNTVKSYQRKQKVQLKIHGGAPDVTIYEISGIFQTEKTPLSKPIIIQVDAKDKVHGEHVVKRQNFANKH